VPPANHVEAQRRPPAERLIIGPMTTVTLPRRLSLPRLARPSWRAGLVGLVGTLLTAALLLTAASLVIGITSQGLILPRVTVAGVEVGGLSRADAEARLEAALPSLSTGQATVAVGGNETVVPYTDIGRGYEMGAMLDAAFGVGRDGDPVSDAVARLRSLAVEVSLPVEVHAFDADAIDAVAATIAQNMSWPAVDASVTAEGTTFTASPSTTGQSLDASTVRSALAAAVATADPSNVRIELAAQELAPGITTADAEAVAVSASAVVAPLELRIPGATADDAPITLAPETLLGLFSIGIDAAGRYGIAYDEAAVTAAVEALRPQIDQEARNASISVAGSGLGGVIAGADGRALNAEASVDAVLLALRGRAGGLSIPALSLAVDVTQAGFTTAQAQALLPQMQLVSSWTTYYVPGEGNGWGNNINIGAFDIDGRNLYPGEWFSFWGSIGPVTVERGYSYGGAIINGRSTQGVAIGGGICSTSTTIFNAALRAGLEMGVRANHYYYIDRYPDGLDATVSIFDGWTQDMTFRNDTENPIVIRGFGGNGWVTFQVWSAPTGRTVVITDPITSNHRSASDSTVVDASMAPGTSRRVEYPHDGHDVSRSRLVYAADGTLLHENHYFSHYATVTGIVAVGPGAAAADPPEETAAEDVAGGADTGTTPP
jgi:vancomycin resistance protein YoaR